MSSPQLGRDVYWRRRLLVLAVLIAIVWGIIQLVGLVFGDDDKETTKPAQQTSAENPTPKTPPAGEEPEPETDAEPAIAPGQPVPLGLTTSQTACDPENIRTVAMVPAEQKAGGPIKLELLISSIDSVACTFTPAKRDLLVVIEANNKAIYDSTVCREPFLNSPVVVAEGFGTLVRTTWSGRGSGKDCSPKEGFAKGGKFELKVGAFGGEPDQTTFVLASAPKPTPTPTPSKTADPEASAKATPKPKPSTTPSEPGND